MGWQKRATGTLFDSMSGHAYIIGTRTNKIIGFTVKTKQCSICRTANKLDMKAEEHECNINWEGQWCDRV